MTCVGYIQVLYTCDCNFAGYIQELYNYNYTVMQLVLFSCSHLI